MIGRGDTWLRRALRLVLLLYPQSFRRRHGEHMIAATCEATRRRCHDVGLVAGLGRAAADIANIAVAGIMERWTSRAGRSPSPLPRDSRSPGVVERMNALFGDLRFALRSLRRQPTFAAVCVLTLGIAIGANVVIFSIVKRVLLDPLPYADADRLVWVNSDHEETGLTQVSAADLADWRAAATETAELAGYMYWSYTFSGLDEPLDVPAARVTPSLFVVLGADAGIGRVFVDSDGVAGGEPVAVVSHWFWQSELGANEDIVGERLLLDGTPHTVVGVMPEGFAFPVDARNGFWTAIANDPESMGDRRAVRDHMVIGRLADGATMASAERELDGLAAALGREYPDTNGAYGARVRSAHEVLIVGAGGSDAIWALFAGVGFLLLIACVNVTNLTLARLSSRDRELAVRVALGAGRGHLVRQFMSETVLLAAAGGALGTLLSVWGIQQVRTLPNLPLSRLGELQLDAGVLLFAVILTLAVGVVFGLLPAGRAHRQALSNSMKESGATAGASAGRTLDALVVVEVALALVLLIGAGLLARTFAELMAIDVGFRRDGLLVANLFIPDTLYAEDHQKLAFYDRVITDIEAIPGVVAAAAVTALPMDEIGIDFSLPYSVVGRDEVDDTPPRAQYRVASPGYFETLAVPLLSGRTFSAQDRADGAPVMLINETLARREFPGSNPVGSSLRIPIGGAHEIVGVVRDVRHYGLGQDPAPEMYIPMAQNPFGGMVMVVRTDGDPFGLIEPVKQAVFGVDPRQPVYEFNSMDDLVAQNVSFPRLNMMLSGLFATVALLLAAVGIYGVMAYTVARRTREIGVRMALGAGTGDALRAVVGRGMVQATLGIALGLAGAFGLTRLLQNQLYSVGALDPTVFVVVPLLFAAVALAATYVPARRAARVDPLIALRNDDK